MKNRKYFRLLLVSLLFPLAGHAYTEQELATKTNRASQVLTKVLNTTDNSIPLSLINKAVCIAVLPDVLRAGFVFGGRIGHGVVSCRVGHGWSQPSFLKIIGGSWGLQIGVSSMDMVLVFVNADAVDRLSVNNFTLGGEVSVAIGPVGRGAQAGTDYELKSEVYSYSQSRGLFAGLTVGGASMQIDHDANSAMYRNKATPRMLLTSDGSYAPSTMQAFVTALDTYAP